MTSRKHQQCFTFDAEPHDIKKCINEGHRVLILMRGVTGSGKSFLAEEFRSVAETHVTHSSTEDITKKVRGSVKDNTPLVLVDLVHAERPDVKKLALIAVEEQYEVFIVEPRTVWKYDAVECQKRSKSGESIDRIQEMINTIKASPIMWDHFVNGGCRNVEISNFHCDIPEFNTPPSSVSSPVAEKRPFSPQLFSMAPEQKTKVMRTCATQITSDNIARNMADLPEINKAGFYDMGDEDVPIVWKEKITMIDRRVQAPGPMKIKGSPFRDRNELLRGTKEELEFSILLAVFQATNISFLRHTLQLYDYKLAFRWMLALFEPVTIGRAPTDGRLLFEELEFNESISVANMTLAEEMEERRLERRALQFIEGQCGPDTSSDALIAATLNDELNREEREITREDIKNIKDLSLLFPDGASLMDGIYEDAGRDFETARRICIKTYDLYEETGISVSERKKTWSRKVADGPSSSSTIVVPRSEREMKNHFLKPPDQRPNISLDDAQVIAFSMRKEINQYRISRMSSVGLNNMRTHEEFRQLRSEIEKKVNDINQHLRNAHGNPWFIDTHYMSVEGAKSLVEEAIEAVRYYLRVDRRTLSQIVVVTGQGNNSLNGPRIKPEVEKMLNRQGIRFEMVNQGCFRLKL